MSKVEEDNKRITEDNKRLLDENVALKSEIAEHLQKIEDFSAQLERLEENNLVPELEADMISAMIANEEDARAQINQRDNIIAQLDARVKELTDDQNELIRRNNALQGKFNTEKAELARELNQRERLLTKLSGQVRDLKRSNEKFKRDLSLALEARRRR